MQSSSSSAVRRDYKEMFPLDFLLCLIYLVDVLCSGEIVRYFRVVINHVSRVSDNDPKSGY